MKSLLIFEGSCGHLDIEEISDAEWEKRTAPFTLHGSIASKENYKNPTRVGRKLRAVYVYPERFFLCRKCALEGIEDTQGWGE